MIRVYIVAIPSKHCCRTAIIVGQGPAVLAAGTGLKLYDFIYLFIFYFLFFFFGGGGGAVFWFYFYGVLQEMKRCFFSV